MSNNERKILQLNTSHTHTHTLRQIYQTRGTRGRSLSLSLYLSLSLTHTLRQICQTIGTRGPLSHSLTLSHTRTGRLCQTIGTRGRSLSLTHTHARKEIIINKYIYIYIYIYILTGQKIRAIGPDMSGLAIDVVILILCRISLWKEHKITWNSTFLSRS